MFVFFGFAQLRMNVNLKVPVTTIEHYFFSPQWTPGGAERSMIKQKTH